MYFAEPETSAIINNEQFLNRNGTRCIGVIDRGKEACRLKQVWQTIEQFDMRPRVAGGIRRAGFDCAAAFAG